MNAIENIRSKARKDVKTIILPEYDDARVIQASRILESEGIARPLLLSPDKVDKKEKQRYIEEFYEAHKFRKELDLETVKQLFEDTLYYAAMMTREGKVDGLVAGASHTTPDMARACMRCIGMEERFNVVSSCFIMEVPDCEYGDQGTFIFADCGIIPDPKPRQLACISIFAAELATKVLGITPRVALLSYSTRGSAKGREIEKIDEALEILKSTAPDLLADGELQVDAAIVPEVTKIKYPDSPLEGRGNILIFPSLEAGNISYKLVQRLAKARALGPLFLGLNKPASDLSRGCLVEDVVDCAAVTAIRAQ